MDRLRHLTRRFFGSLRPGGPPPSEQQWAESQLLPGERAIWCSLSGPDRRHSAEVARRVQRSLGDQATRPVLAAALLHDCGKLDSGLRTPGRVVATILAATTVRTESEVQQWANSSIRWKQRVGVYRLHPERGADMLTGAGSEPLTIAWTREHHQPAAQWTVEPALATALHEADDD